jgi:cysteine desulfurase/selenocysteine lyase
MTTAAIPQRLDPEAYRPDFPILSTILPTGVPLSYLDNAATSQRPRQVIQAIVDTYQQHYANVHRGIHWLADQSTDLYTDAREKVRAFINAPRDEEDLENPVKTVIFTSGATAAINLVARSWGDANVGEGDEVLLSEMEHHSNLVPWQQLAQRRGARLRHIPVTDEGLLDLESLDELLTRRTKLVSVTAISNVLGTITPVEEIIRRAHAVGALVLVDGAQSVPHLATDVTALDVDFLVFSGHKMLGPSGVGVLYGKRELLEAMPAFMGGGSMISRVKLDTFEPAGLPAKFEAGTPPIVPAIGLGAAIDYLNRVGIEAIADYESYLTKRAHEVLRQVPGLRIFGPDVQHKSGIVSFTLDGVHAHDIAQGLDQQGIAVRAGHHCAMPLHKRLGVTATARASFYFYNTPAEIDRLAEAFDKIRETFRKRSRHRPNP